MGSQLKPPSKTSVPTNTKTRVAYTASWWQIHAWAIGGVALYFMYEQFYLINNIHTIYNLAKNTMFTI